METTINGMTEKEFYNQEDKVVKTTLEGRQVTFVTGPGESPEPEFCDNIGTILTKIKTKWGSHYEVLMLSGNDEGKMREVTNFTKVGIGAYLI